MRIEVIKHLKRTLPLLSLAFTAIVFAASCSRDVIPAAPTGPHVTALAQEANGRTSVISYDNFEKSGGYTLADYQSKWANIYGLGEMAVHDTRTFAGGHFSVSAVPFATGADYSVYDHLKYIAVSTQSFPVPQVGSVTFSCTIQAQTPGTQPGRVIEGHYVADGLPYAASTLEGQQAGVVMNMIDFATGQLFDWFVSGSTAFPLIERLPSAVTNPGLPPGDPAYVGRSKMYTQIIEEIPIGPGPHTVAITFTRDTNDSRVEYFFDGRRVSKIKNVGVPLDVQRVPYTGTYPSLGSGEPLFGKISSLVIGHGLFSLLDAFPFQHPEVPELNVSIPLENRLFGQGASAVFDDFVVTTVSKQ